MIRRQAFKKVVAQCEKVSFILICGGMSQLILWKEMLFSF